MFVGGGQKTINATLGGSIRAWGSVETSTEIVARRVGSDETLASSFVADSYTFDWISPTTGEFEIVLDPDDLAGCFDVIAVTVSQRPPDPEATVPSAVDRGQTLLVEASNFRSPSQLRLSYGTDCRDEGPTLDETTVSSEGTGSLSVSISPTASLGQTDIVVCGGEREFPQQARADFEVTNVSPVIEGLSTLELEADETSEIKILVSDPDGSGSLYQTEWSLTGPEADEGFGLVAALKLPPGRYSFEVDVTDEDLGTASRTFELVVAEGSSGNSDDASEDDGSDSVRPDDKEGQSDDDREEENDDEGASDDSVAETDDPPDPPDPCGIKCWIPLILFILMLSAILHCLWMNWRHGYCFRAPDDCGFGDDDPGTSDPCDGPREIDKEKTEEANSDDSAAQTAEARAEAAETELAECEAESHGQLAPFGSDSAIKETLLDLASVVNPAAPKRADNMQGWFVPDRSDVVARVVVDDLRDNPLFPTATAFRDHAASSAEPASSHVVVAAGGWYRLLDDSFQSMSDGQVDNGALSVGIVGDAAEDTVVAMAARWVADAVRSNKLGPDAVEVRGRLDREAFLARVNSSTEPSLDLAAPVEVDPCRDLRSEAERLRREAVEARRRARDSAEKATSAHRDVIECDCQDLPATGEAPEDEPSDESGYYLLKHQNPNAPRQANGRNGHYRTQRRGEIRGIVIHVSHATVNQRARNVAGYFSTVDRPASAHVATDETGIIHLMPDNYEAFHVKPFKTNRHALGIEICYGANNWGQDPVTEAAQIAVAAIWVGGKAEQYGIPVRRLTKEQWARGERGFVAHGDLDPGRRIDPGANFPWDEFLEACSVSESVALVERASRFVRDVVWERVT